MFFGSARRNPQEQRRHGLALSVAARIRLRFEMRRGQARSRALSLGLSNAHFRSLGLRFVRYADDANIYVRSERASLRVMESIKRFITQKLKLKVRTRQRARWRDRRNGFQLVLRRNLPQKIANSGRHLPRQHPLAVFRAPHKITLRSYFAWLLSRYRRIMRLYLPFASPEGEGLEPRRGQSCPRVSIGTVPVANQIRTYW